MTETHPCTFGNCNKIFLKAYELKKHKATHEDPNSVYYCSQCDFFTLQKKNLGIHFATHTGEKTHHCPEMITYIGPGSLSRKERCEYRTNDPAALTRHRKKVHGYIPPPNRSRRSRIPPAPPRKHHKPRQKQVGKASRHPRAFQCPVPVSRRKPSCLSRVNNSLSSGAGYSSASTELPGDSPTLWEGDIDTHRQWMDPDVSDVPRSDSFASSDGTWVVPEEEMNLATLHDPSLHFEWMANYEMGYSVFDTTGTSHLLESPRTASPSTSPGLDTQTDREGCLCPEWMVEAGIEGWDRSALETNKEFQVFDACA